MRLRFSNATNASNEHEVEWNVSVLRKNFLRGGTDQSDLLIR